MTAPRPELIDVVLHGRRVAVRTVGAGPALLLIHGLGGSRHTWDAVVPALAQHSTVIVPDLPGNGDSEPPAGDYSLGAYASGLRDLLDALGRLSATVVGHSLGGGVAMQFAYQFPDRCDRLVLVSSGGLGSEVSAILRAASLPGSELVIPLIANRRTNAVGEALARWAGAVGLRARPEQIESARTYAGLASPVHRTTFLQTLRAVVDHHGQRIDASDRLHLTADMATLIVWGADDTIIPVAHAHRAHESMPTSQLVVMDGSGHFPHVAHPARFAALLNDFLAARPVVTRRRHSSA